MAVFPLSRWERAVCTVRAMMSSVDLLGRYAHWRGSKVTGREEQMWVLANRSKHFRMMEVSATGPELFRQVMGDFFDTGMMVVGLKQVGTAD